MHLTIYVYMGERGSRRKKKYYIGTAPFPCFLVCVKGKRGFCHADADGSSFDPLCPIPPPPMLKAIPCFYEGDAKEEEEGEEGR